MMKPLAKGLLLMATGVLCLSGCAAVGPNYHAPQAPVPAAYAGASATTPGTALDDADFRVWWRGFHDPVLDALVARALAINPDVKTAVSHIRQARDQERIAGAAGQPSLSANGQAGETHLSKNGGFGSIAKALGGGGAGGGGTPAGLPGTSFANFQTGFDAAWELDVFGGVRRSVEAARAATAAAQWSARDAEVSLAAEVANDYLALRGAQTRMAFARSRLAARQANLEFVQARARHGFVTTLEVNQQAAQADNAGAEAPPLQAEIDTRIHALGVLLGQTPDSLGMELAKPAALPDVPPTVPVGLPSDLLRRRPDIRAAERQLASATAKVGVATADLYPSFNLAGAGDLISTSLATLVAADSLQGNIAGVIRWPILDGGKSRANIAVAKEVRAQAALAYERAVLRALKDVEDALSRYDAERHRRAWLDRTAAAAAEALDTARVRYRGGLTPFTNVLDAQETRLAAQDQQAQSATAADEALVSLYKALGGGWRAADPREANEVRP